MSAGWSEAVPDEQAFLWSPVNVDEEAAAVGGEFFRLTEEFLRAMYLYRALLHVDVELDAALESNRALKSWGFAA